MSYSDFIVYVDESGDHSLAATDPGYPVFVLAFCIFEKEPYVRDISPNLQRFKFAHFGHDMVILHEHEIRKSIAPFTFLLNVERRQVFMSDLNTLMIQSRFTIISVVIRKDRLKERNSTPDNPYHLALGYGLEKLNAFFLRHGQAGKTVHLVFESRGKKEDDDLELEFRRMCDHSKFEVEGCEFAIVFARKGTNACGLQLADLVARPIGRHAINPEQENRAYDILKAKLDRSPEGEVEDWGYKCLP